MKKQNSSGKKSNPFRAKRLAKTLLKNDLNAAATGRELGITKQAVRDQIKNNPLVKTALEKYLEALEKAGATDEKSARVISEAMDAKTSKGVGHGEDFEIVQEDDHFARLKANDQYLKLKRLVASGAETKAENHLHLHLGDKKDQELLEAIEQMIPGLKRNKDALPTPE